MSDNFKIKLTKWSPKVKFDDVSVCTCSCTDEQNKEVQVTWKLEKASSNLNAKVENIQIVINPEVE